MHLVNRAAAHDVALETTLLVHGVPADAAMPLHHEIGAILGESGARPALVGVVDGAPTVGMTDDELGRLLRSASTAAKANTSNLGALAHRGESAATTVSATMELAARAGLRVFATGGIGGVHRGYGARLDISSDLAALARFPVAVVASGVKSILDIASTREALESLGVPVIGYRTDSFPAFYSRSSDAGVDARFDDPADLAAFLGSELARTGRGILVANPIPAEHEVDRALFDQWHETVARAVRARGVTGRGVTPAVLAGLHEVSQGKTLASNIALVKSNAALAGGLASAMGGRQS